MPLLNVENAIRQLNDFDDLKPLLRQIVDALNTLHDSKGRFSKDIVFESEEAGIVMRRQGGDASTGDGNWVRLVPTGIGSTTTTWDDLGKERP